MLAHLHISLLCGKATETPVQEFWRQIKLTACPFPLQALGGGVGGCNV